MPYFDLTCPDGHERIDVFLKVGERPPCVMCGKPTETLWRGKAACIVDDTFVGGRTIENLSAKPITFGSRSEQRRYMREHGFQEKVEHVPVQGSDRSPHTTRWI